MTQLTKCNMKPIMCRTFLITTKSQTNLITTKSQTNLKFTSYSLYDIKMEHGKGVHIVCIRVFSR